MIQRHVRLLMVVLLLWCGQAGIASAAGNEGNGNGNGGGLPAELVTVQANVYQLQQTVQLLLAKLAESQLALEALQGKQAQQSNQLLQMLLSAEDTIKVYNVKNSTFGAKGDGITDDSAAVQAALSAAKEAGGGLVFFPEGTYSTTANLSVYSNTHVFGVNAKIEKAATGAGDSVMDVVYGQSRVTIEGLWLDNKKARGNIGIDLRANTSHVQIVHNKFTGMRTQAVNANNLGIKHIQVSGNLFQEVAFGILTNSRAKDIEDLRITDNTFLDVYDDAIELNHPGTAYIAGANIIIANNFITVPADRGSGSTAGFGIGIAGATNVSITGNVIKNARYEAIHIEDEAKHISIVGNIINGVENDPAINLNSGIYVIDGDYITIADNSISNANDYGIHLEFATGRTATNTIISGNTVTKSGTGGIKVNAEGLVDIIVTDNVVTDNTGHGITVGGGTRNVKITNNISRGNTGYGLYLNGTGLGWHIEGNSLHGNTTGDIGYNAATYTYPAAIRDNHTIVTGTVVTNYTDWTNTFSLGQAAEGILYITAAKNPARSTEMYKVTWDGKNATFTLIGSDNYGTMDVTVPRMSGKILQVQAYNPNGTTLTFDVSFEGVIMLK